MKTTYKKSSDFRSSLRNTLNKIHRKCCPPASCHMDSPKTSLIVQQRLPALARMSMEDQKEHIMPLQVIKRMENLKLSENDLLWPEKCEEEICSLFLNCDVEDHKTQALFTGNTAGELNAFLLKHAGMTVLVQSREVFIDETIRVPDHTFLKGENTILTAGGGKIDVVFYLAGRNHAAVTGFILDGNYLYGIYISDSKDIMVCGNTFRHIARKPVTVTGNSARIMVCGCVFEENGQGGIQINGNAADVLIEGNVIEGSKGSDNWSAGIVLTANGIPDTADDGNGDSRLSITMDRERMLYDMLSAPYRIVMRNNIISHNNSSGIYCFGPYMVYITHNQIFGNDKEGICLDFGTLGGYAAYNDVMLNGGRTRQTDRDLEHDFVLEIGRLEDGSSPAKLPGISIDNSAYNMIYNNRIEGNYGSGVKMVRTGIRNIISTNIINGNNQGAEQQVSFFRHRAGQYGSGFCGGQHGLQA